MKRMLFGGVIFAFFGAITVPSKPAAKSKPTSLIFVFLRTDPAQGVAILRPMIAPDLGVQLDSAAQTMKPGTVVRCAAVTREHPATVDGQPAKVTELALDCGDHQFLVRGLDFSPHR